MSKIVQFEAEKTLLNSRLSPPLESLVVDESLAWDDKGRGVASKPIPRVGEQSRWLLSAEQDRLNRLLEPGKPNQIMQQLIVLRARYPQRDIDPRVMDCLVAEDLEDFAPYPIDLLRLACQRWRRKADKEAQFAPTNGQLIDLMCRELYDRQQRLRRVNKLLELALRDSV